MKPAIPLCYMFLLHVLHVFTFWGVREINKNRQIACFFPGVQIVERRRQIHEEKNEGRQLNSLSTDRRALPSERLDGTGYVR